MTGDPPQDRMPPIPAERMTEAQREAAAELVAGPRGAVAGPFIPLLRSPDLLSRLQRTGEYLRFHSALPPRLLELAILLVSRQWTQQFEWATHQPLALRAGLKAEVTQAILEGRRPAGLSEGEETVADFLEELSRARCVSDATYARAVALLGEEMKRAEKEKFLSEVKYYFGETVRGWFSGLMKDVNWLMGDEEGKERARSSSPSRSDEVYRHRIRRGGGFEAHCKKNDFLFRRLLSEGDSVKGGVDDADIPP